MDYEKAYKDALERAKKVKHDVQSVGCAMNADMLEVVFPELAESDDEKIRKDIIALVKFALKDGSAVSPGSHTTKEDALAYLERQKEYIEDIRQYAYNKGLVDAEEKQKENHWVPSDEQRHALGMVLKYSDHNDESTKVLESLLDDLTKIANPKVAKWKEKWKEKWEEQKPAIIQWTGKNLKEVIDFTGKSPKFGEWFKSWEEFESYVHSHGDILKLFCEDGSHYEVPVGAWIVKTPDGYNVPSVARFVSSSTERQRRNANGCLSWKEFKDDDSGIPALLVSEALIRRDGKYSTGFNIISGDEYILIRDIEAAIEQKPAEWSEEDERMLERLICDYNEAVRSSNGNAWKKVFQENLNWLKSLRPQPHWKPGEEQIRPLEYAIDYFKKKKNDTTYLESLINDLKKL